MLDVHVSVLTACHNFAPFLRQMLESSLAETKPADEIIVVDDGFTDGSVAGVESFAERDIWLIRQENRDASAACNRAFAASTGLLVIFVDADDVVGPRHLESLCACFSFSGRMIMLNKWDRFHSDLDETRFSPSFHEAQHGRHRLTDARLVSSPPHDAAGNVFISRILVEEHGRWNEGLSLVDDFEFFTRIISRSNGIRFAPNASPRVSGEDNQSLVQL